jgi:hypothetical protein
VRALAVILLTFAVVSCGKADKPLIGAWERTLTTPRGDLDRQVLEFLDSGKVLLHATHGEIGAAFKGTGKTISLKDGALAKAWPGKISYRVTGKKLVIDRADNGKQDHSEWSRIDKPPLFAMKIDHGAEVPTGMPAFLASLTTKLRHYWHDDAVATSFATTRLPAGDYAMLVAFYSPADQKSVRALVTRWGITTTPMRTASSTPLPADFKDLPALLSKERNTGKDGALLNAALVVAGNRPVWAITTSSKKPSATDFYSATDGKVVKAAEIIPSPSAANSNSPANGAFSSLIPAMAGGAVLIGGNNGFDQPSPDSGGSSASAQSDTSNNGTSGEPAPGETLPNGETCYYSTYAACNAAANGDTWAADRIENGTASGSEQDWYGGAGTANEENTQPESNEQPSNNAEPSYQPPENNEPTPSYEPEPSYEPAPSYEPPPEPSYEPPPSSEGSGE